jgi:hypothetical protein
MKCGNAFCGHTMGVSMPFTATAPDKAIDFRVKSKEIPPSPRKIGVPETMQISLSGKM